MFGEKQSVAGATVSLDEPQPSAEDPDNWGVLVSTYRVGGEERIVDASGSPVLVYVDRIAGQWRVVAVQAHGLVTF